MWTSEARQSTALAMSWLTARMTGASLARSLTARHRSRRVLSSAVWEAAGEVDDLLLAIEPLYRTLHLSWNSDAWRNVSPVNQAHGINGIYVQRIGHRQNDAVRLVRQREDERVDYETPTDLVIQDRAGRIIPRRHQRQAASVARSRRRHPARKQGRALTTSCGSRSPLSPRTRMARSRPCMSRRPRSTSSSPTALSSVSVSSFAGSISHPFPYRPAVQLPPDLGRLQRPIQPYQPAGQAESRPEGDSRCRLQIVPSMPGDSSEEPRDRRIDDDRRQALPSDPAANRAKQLGIAVAKAISPAQRSCRIA